MVVVLVAGVLVPEFPRVGAQTVESAVLVGAGDIAQCSHDRDEATARLVDAVVAETPSATVFTLGDNAYEQGTDAEFRNCYGPTWGRHRDRTMPALGDHEYDVSPAAYFNYFGPRVNGPDGWYSYTAGAWKVFALNSRCTAVGGCQVGSRQEQWLRSELAASAAECTMAYFHRPLFTSTSKHPSSPEVLPFWNVLYEYGADVIVNSHSHHYERFAPQTPSGNFDPNFGIRQFVSGTGGRGLYGFLSTARANSERRILSHGVTKLTLDPGSYSWQFIPVPGSSETDSGSATCHGRPGGTPPPSSSTTSSSTTSSSTTSTSTSTTSSTTTSSTTSTTGPPSSSPVSFRAVADARVIEASPDTNFGSATTLEVDASPNAQSYLRFTTTGLTGTVQQAVLRLYVSNSSSNGPGLYQTTGAWQENTITWRNRPARDPATVVANIGSVSSGGYIDYDVTALVRNRMNATYDFKLDPDSTDGTDFHSDEGPNPPRLIVTTG